MGTRDGGGGALPSLSFGAVLDQFGAAMRAAGLDFEQHLQADGRLHRFRVQGDKPGSKNGWYVLHADGVPAGAFGCYKRDIRETWRADIGRSLTAEEEAAHRARLDAMQKARAAAEAQRQERGRSAAVERWQCASSSVDPEHPYLVRKRVQAHGIRQDGDALLVPVRNVRGEIRGLQEIHGDGSKKFTPGTSKKGHYHAIGKRGDRIIICEGYATGATLYEALGDAIAVAFDAGNLVDVAKALRAKHPRLALVLAADNDAGTQGNPGATKARAAAAAVGGCVVIPSFEQDGAGTDWNDYAALYGLPAVREAFAPPAAGAPDSFAGETEAEPGGDDRAAPLQPHFELRRDGVYWCDVIAEGGKVRQASPLFLCSPIKIEAVTRDSRDRNFGRLLAFRDLDGNAKSWALPARLLGGSKGDELRGELLDAGLPIISTEPKAQRKLIDYLMREVPQARARCVSRTGWHGGTFVMPAAAYGAPGGEQYYLQGDALGSSVFERGGSLQGWIEEVAQRCAPHAWLRFALACAFAGPLLDVLGGESGGFHLVGGSSTGKTTALRLASSVWGDPSSFMRQWRSTDNGLEAIAEEHSDCLLALDEIGQADPKTLGEMAYMLANGRGKQRAQRNGNARGVKQWRSLILSTGEAGTSALLNAAGHSSRAGHEVRLVEFPADRGRGFGVFDAPAGSESVRELADELKAAAGRHFGHAGPRFAERLAGEREHVQDALRGRVAAFVENVRPGGADGQVLRVAARFGLVEAAASRAIAYGLLPWSEREAEEACLAAFEAWLSRRGTAGAREPAAMIAQVRAYIEANGSAQFPDISEDVDKEGFAISRAGFRKVDRMGKKHYLVLVERFKKDVCRGFEPRDVCRALDASGILKKQAGVRDRYTVKERTPLSEKPIDVYALDAARLFDYEA